MKKVRVLPDKSSATFSPSLYPDDDIVITIGIHKGLKGVKGYPANAKLRIWKKTKKGTYVQMGMIHKFKMMADSTKAFPSIEVTQSETCPEFSAPIKKVLDNNKQFFQKCGIRVVETKFKT